MRVDVLFILVVLLRSLLLGFKKDRLYSFNEEFIVLLNGLETLRFRRSLFVFRMDDFVQVVSPHVHLQCFTRKSLHNELDEDEEV